MAEYIFNIFAFALPVIFSITAHEASHGLIAYWFGDDTAYRLNRITLNPLRHIDIFGTIILPIILFLAGGIIFGFAKPVPVNFYKLYPYRFGTIMVALAGPLTNIILAILSGFLINAAPFFPSNFAIWWINMLTLSIQLNYILALFNMIPLLPLDGGRVLFALLPWSLNKIRFFFEKWGIALLLCVVFLIPFVASKMGYDIRPLAWILERPVGSLYDHTLNITVFNKE
ncbi:MAG: site-2 protease family protein [Alphaproteobacteria bacterium]|nr:site-2 protease family protein [Alphaproteobacteria bacterium]